MSLVTTQTGDPSPALSALTVFFPVFMGVYALCALVISVEVYVRYQLPNSPSKPFKTRIAVASVASCFARVMGLLIL